MRKAYKHIGRETLDLADIAPLDLFRSILTYRDDDDETPLDWDWPYSDDDDALRQLMKTHLDAQPMEVLRPIEDHCVRIKHLASKEGIKSLEHVAKERLDHETYETLRAQPDELCRSIWMFLNHQRDFRDAEAFHAVRQYRDHGKMYDAFEIDAGDACISDAEEMDRNALASLLTARLELPSKVEISTVRLRATEAHPLSLLVIIRHAGPLSSVFHHKDGGTRKTIYFRPPNEASLVWTPTEGMIEVCGVSPQVRRSAAETFAEIVFKADLSQKPLSWRYYDLSRFHASLALQLPLWDDIDIQLARVIEVEMRLGNWSRRLSLRVTIDDDIEKIAKLWLGGARFLRRVEGISRVSIAVKYKRPSDRRLRSLEISFGDRRSNLQSKASVDDRDLGYKLLQHWGILNRLKPLEYDEVAEILPQLLQLHDLPEDEISGGLLRRLGLDARRLLDGGILAFKARQSRILMDDDDEVLIEPSPREGEVVGIDTFHESAGTLPAEDTRLYELRREWLDEVVLTALRPLIGKGRIENLTDDLIFLGTWRRESVSIPLYLVRGIENADRLQASDLALRSRQEAGVGIVLTLVGTSFKHLGPNVVVPLPEILVQGKLDDSAVADLWQRFVSGRWLALGGAEVALMKFGKQTGMLYIPGKVPLPVLGPKQLVILDMLVAAHKAGAPGVPTGRLIEGTGVRSPVDAWNSKVRKSVVDVYFENSGYGLWSLRAS
ncbi:hypothetical protein [Tabrizicola sp. M-4]|uniref:hypothetical protein n=1 Tax=Tabrizicola sp. M-4 TaxID=3055847 RepID=UPI003DA7D6B3